MEKCGKRGKPKFEFELRGGGGVGADGECGARIVLQPSNQVNQERRLVSKNATRVWEASEVSEPRGRLPYPDGPRGAQSSLTSFLGKN